MCGNIQKELRIGYGAKEDSARTKIVGHVLEHNADLLERLECIVHTKLHRDDVEWGAEAFRRYDAVDGSLDNYVSGRWRKQQATHTKAVKRMKFSIEPLRGSHLHISVFCLRYRDSGNVWEHHEHTTQSKHK